jgi:hypothetical protein
MKNRLIILALVIGLSSIACAQWTNPPSGPGATPGLTPGSMASLLTNINARVPKPTNTWANGYVITTYDGGTTTAAVANDNSGLPLETAARIAADASLSNAVSALQGANYATNDQWAADVAAASRESAEEAVADAEEALHNVHTPKVWHKAAAI